MNVCGKLSFQTFNAITGIAYCACVAGPFASDVILSFIFFNYNIVIYENISTICYFCL